MIELNIQNTGLPAHANEYEVVISFMENDADGYQYETIRFPEGNLDDTDFRNEFERFLISVTAAIEKDNKGRGGFTESIAAVKEYQNIPDWGTFCYTPHEQNEDDVLEEYEIDKYHESGNFGYGLPCYSYEWYTSYYKLNIFYYDERGTKFDVLYEIK